MAARAISAGRRRTQVFPIQDAHARQVTFSKRKAGIFKKACELATLCGVEMAILIFSPSGKAYSFGNPSFGAVVDRFENSDQPVSDSTCDEADLRELNEEYSDVLQQLAVARKRGVELRKMAKQFAAGKSLAARPHDELSLEELKELRDMLIDLQEQVNKLKQGLSVEQAAPGPNTAAIGDASSSDPEKEISSDVETGNGVGREE